MWRAWAVPRAAVCRPGRVHDASRRHAAPRTPGWRAGVAPRRRVGGREPTRWPGRREGFSDDGVSGRGVRARCGQTRPRGSHPQVGSAVVEGPQRVRAAPGSEGFRWAAVVGGWPGPRGARAPPPGDALASPPADDTADAVFTHLTPSHQGGVLAGPPGRAPVRNRLTWEVSPQPEAWERAPRPGRPADLRLRAGSPPPRTPDADIGGDPAQMRRFRTVCRADRADRAGHGGQVGPGGPGGAGRAGRVWAGRVGRVAAGRAAPERVRGSGRRSCRGRGWRRRGWGR